MKLEDQVCSLELAKRLKELEVNQNSLYRWINFLDNQWEVTALNENYIKSNFPIIEVYHAFTAAEFGAMLPNVVQKPNAQPFDCFRLQISKFISIENDQCINNFILAYECVTHEPDCFLFPRKLGVNIYDPNLANAMAKMYIYLIEKSIIEVNK